MKTLVVLTVFVVCAVFTLGCATPLTVSHSDTSPRMNYKKQVETKYPLPVSMTLVELQQRNYPRSYRHRGR